MFIPAGASPLAAALPEQLRPFAGHRKAVELQPHGRDPQEPRTRRALAAYYERKGEADKAAAHRLAAPPSSKP